jgi:hypothetical protein
MTAKIREIERYFVPEGAKPGDHVYRIRNTLDSSMKFGYCEVCVKFANDVHDQVEGVLFLDEEKNRLEVYHNGNLFGHYECLIGARRP